MTKRIQVRNVPDVVHRALKRKADFAGKSLSGWLLDELSRSAGLPSEEELLGRLGADEPFAMDASSAALVREDRDSA